MRFFALLTSLYFAFCPAADSQESPVAKSLAMDAGVWALTYSMERFWYLPQGQRSFFSDGLDDQIREAVHTSSDTYYYNNAERRWRKFSDLGVFTLVGASIAQPIFSDASRLNALAVSRAFAITNFTTTLMKNAVHRSRPKAARYADAPQDGDDAKSFPSGHAANAFVAATSYALLNPESPLWVRSLIYTTAGSVAMARVISDRHNFTDVTVGAFIGYGITSCVIQSQKSASLQITANINSMGLDYTF